MIMSKEQYEFKWTTELVNEFFEYVDFLGHNDLQKAMEEFKKSKQPKKEWEIVELISNEGFKKSSWNMGKQVPIDVDGINFDVYSIYSVRRLFDGEVFTVGDDDIPQPDWAKLGQIKNFYISKDDVCCLVENGLAFWYTTINNLRHAPKPKKKSLFTTEDGVKVFPCDDFHVAALDTGSIGSMRANESDRGVWLGAKLFSTKEKAEEYILLNRPCLSVNDVTKIICDNNRLGVDYSISRDLKQLAKEKIKQ